jgi:hypothetical protein
VSRLKPRMSGPVLVGCPAKPGGRYPDPVTHGGGYLIPPGFGPAGNKDYTVLEWAVPKADEEPDSCALYRVYLPEDLVAVFDWADWNILARNDPDFLRARLPLCQAVRRLAVQGRDPDPRVRFSVFRAVVNEHGWNDMTDAEFMSEDELRQRWAPYKKAAKETVR